MITHVIQASYTVIYDNHSCARCGVKAHFMFTSYESVDEETHKRMLMEASQARSKKEASQKAKRSVYNDIIYNATFKEQECTGPIMHYVSYDCFTHAASFLSDGMGIAHSGEILLAQLMQKPLSHAIFLIRDISCPDRWGIVMVPHQDARLLQDELKDTTTTIQLENI